MKVLHVITNFAGVGGAEKMLARLVESAPECDHSIVALMQFSDIYQHALDKCNFHEQLNWNLINTPTVLWKLKNIIDTLKPDIIQGWMYHANVFSSVAVKLSQTKPPLVWGIRHSLDAVKEESVSTKVALQASKFLSKTPTATVYCAHSALKKHIQFGFTHPHNLVIPNGVVLQSQPVVRQFNHKNIIIGFAGRYHKAKGFQYLFEAISKIQKKNSDVVFRLAGSGVSLANPEILAFVEQYQVDIGRITFCEQVSDMISFYNSLDLLVLTSITEGFPNVLVEAMATGVPCVSTDVGDAGVIIDDTGFIVASKNSEAIADAVLKYTHLQPAEREYLSNSAFKLIQERYQLASVTQMYIHTWRGLVN